MKRFIFAVSLSAVLLSICAFVIVPSPVKADPDAVQQLLSFPAPPPLNPLVAHIYKERGTDFYDVSKPPADDAPIDDLLEYWRFWGGRNQGPLYYKPTASPKTVARLLQEIKKDPKQLSEFLAILPDDGVTVDAVRAIYNDRDSRNAADEDEGLRSWLRLNSAQFSDELQRGANRLRDTNNYVDQRYQNELLALTKHNYDAAQPIIDRLYRDASQPVTQALATWALYRRALDENSQNDIERFRSELMRMVENRTLANGVRDMANDAIVRERDFPGRDEWSISLFEDETLVSMPEFTMLTTMVMYAPPDKYVPKMIELLESKNINVRTAAANNLVIAMQRQLLPEKNRQIVQALLPVLTNRKWLNGDDEKRATVVRALQTLKIPESVPALIAALDERQEVEMPDGFGPGAYTNANAAVRAAVNSVAAAVNSAAIAANMSNYASNAAANAARPATKTTVYPLRNDAIAALGTQGDSSAVPALRRMFGLVESYVRTSVVKSIFLCNGFSVQEQVDALEEASRSGVVSLMENRWAPIANSANTNVDEEQMRAMMELSRQILAGDVRYGSLEFELMLAGQLGGLKDPSNELVNAAALRINDVDKKEPFVANSMRNVIATWSGPAVNALMLSDLKRGRTSTAAIVKLLTERKYIREHQTELVHEAFDGNAVSNGVAACLLDSGAEYAEILQKGSADAKIALLACARLVRAKLPINVVAKELKSTDPRLKTAAESYLESEDSPEARSTVLSLHKNEAKILGATTHFSSTDGSPGAINALQALFATVHPYFADIDRQHGGPSYAESFEKLEKRLQKEVIENSKLDAVYAYGDSYIRIYKDEFFFSWEDDPSRYRERKLSKEEFDGFKNFLLQSDAENFAPFLACRGYCESKQLTMVSRDGGRRIYVQARETPKFFETLESMIAYFKSKPAKLHYRLEKDLPGLEILYADDSRDASTVWKNGNDLRIVVTDMAAVRNAERRMRSEDEDFEDNEDESEYEIRYARLAARYRYEGVGWYRVGHNGSLTAAEQPDAVEYIVPSRPETDDIPTPAWKSTAGGIELRGGRNGLFKIVNGRSTKLSSDAHTQPVVSGNGQWGLAFRYSDENYGLVRYNLASGRGFPVKSGDTEEMVPVAYLASVNRFVIGMPSYGEERSHLYGISKFLESTLLLLDPSSGAVSRPRGELRPLAHQTFRPLQAAAGAHKFWASMPDETKVVTQVGIYDSRTLSFQPVLTIPTVSFTSMEMWVDEAAGKVFFIHSGHLLSLPLTSKPPKS